MPALYALAILLAGLVSPLSAVAANCTLSGTGNLSCNGTTCSTTMADSCAGVAPGDNITITGTATANGDLVLSGAGRIVVTGAGSLTCTVASGCGLIALGTSTAGGTTNDSGTASGGSWTVRGQYLDPVAATWGNDRPTTRLPIGGLQHCGSGGNCNAGGGVENVMRFTWPIDKAAGAAGDSNVQDVIAQVQAGDVACFYPESPESPFGVMHDANFCYEVTASFSASLPYYIEVDVRQGAIDRYGYGLAQRALCQAEVLEVNGFNQVVIQLDPTTDASCEAMIDRSGRGVGRWMRVGTAGKPFKIMRVDLNTTPTPDEATLETPLSVLGHIAAGNTITIDYGWQPGDGLLIFRPVVITDAALSALSAPIGNETAEQAAGAFSFLAHAGLHFEAVRFDRLDAVRIGGSGTPTGAELFRSVWYSDPTNAVGGGALGTAFGFIAPAAPASTFDFVTVTGGASHDCTDDAGKSCGHTFNIARAPTPRFADVSVRYNGDDFLIYSVAGADVFVRRAHGQFAANNPNSAQCVEVTGANSTVDIQGVVCDAMPPWNLTDATIRGTARDLVSFQSEGSIGLGNAFTPSAVGATRFRNVAVFGGTLSDLGTTQGMVPRFVDGFWVQGARLGDASARLIASDVVSLRNGVFLGLDPAGQATAIEAPANVQNAVVSNVAFVDVWATARAFRIGTAANSNAVYQHITWVNRAGSPGIATRPWSFGESSNTGAITFRDLLFWVGGNTTRIFEHDHDNVSRTYSFEGTFCTGLSGTGDEYLAESLTELVADGATPIRDQRPPFVDLDAWPPRVDTRPDWRGCGDAGIKRGVYAPGVRYNWALGKSGLPSLVMGDEMGSRGQASVVTQ